MLPRRLRIALVALGCLVLLVVATSIALHALIQRQDHEFIRDQIIGRVAETTGYTLRIDGPLELPYALKPTIVLHDIVLNAHDTPGDENLLSADSFRVTVAVLPLLENRLRIDDTTLNNASLRMEFDDTGRANWIPEAIPDAGESDIVVEVHAINFEQIDIRFLDRRVGVEFGARIAELRLSAPSADTFVDVELVAEFEDLPIRAEGRISDRDNAFAGLELPVSLAGTILDMAFAIDGHINRVVGAPIDELGFFARLQLRGSSMAAFNDVTGLPLPPTDSFDIVGNVEGRPGTIAAGGIVGRLQKGALTLDATGRIGRLNSFDELALDATLVGDDLQNVPYFDPGELPASDSFSIAAFVSGDWPALRLAEIEADAVRNDISVAASGLLGDASKFGDADLDVRVSGADLADLVAIFDLPSGETRAYRGSGRLQGSWPDLSVSGAVIDLERDDMTLRLRGGVRHVNTLRGIDARIEAKGNDLALVPEFLALELPATDEFSFVGDLSGDAQRLAARSMSTTARRGSHEVSATGTIEDLRTLTGIDMALRANGTDLRELNDVLAPEFPHTERYEFTSKLIGNFDDLSAREMNLAGSVPGLDLELAGDIGTIIELRNLDLQGKIGIDDPSEFGEWSGVVLPPDMQIELSGHMAGTAPNFDLSGLTYRSGESLVHGNARMIVGEKLSFSGAVTSGRLDVRPFLRAAIDETPETREGEDDGTFSDEPFDFSWLDTVDVSFSLDDLEIVRAGENVIVPNAAIVVEQGSLKIDPLEMRLEDERVSGHFYLDRAGVPAVDADLSLENIDLSKFLEDIRLRDFYEGSFDFALDVSTQGNSVGAMAGNLDGELAVFISDAKIAGVDLQLQITDVLLGALPWLEREDEVNINCAMSEMLAEDGIVDVRLLYLDSAQLRMMGGGTVDLRNETFDLRLAPRPRGTRIFAHNIDLLVTGSLSDPDIATTGAARTVATKYGKYALLGPAGLLVPSERSRKHPCIGSLQEYRNSQESQEETQ